MGWVTERYSCDRRAETLNLAIQALRSAVKKDVGEAEVLCGGEADQFRFVESEGRTSFIVTGLPIGGSRGGALSRFEFQLDRENGIIRISRERPSNLDRSLDTLKITQQWDAAWGTCKLYMNGQQTTVDIIAQTAMGPVFFETP